MACTVGEVRLNRLLKYGERILYDYSLKIVKLVIPSFLNRQTKVTMFIDHEPLCHITAVYSLQSTACDPDRDSLLAQKLAG